MTRRDGVNFETVSERLRKDIAYHAKWQDHDFKRSEQLKWGSILVSAASTVLILVFGSKDKAQLLAIPAALSTLLVWVDQRMPYRARSGWHFNLKIGLEELLLRLDKDDPDEVERARIELEKRFANTFPGGRQSAG